MKILFYSFATVIVVISVFFFFFLPKFADRRMNRVGNRPFVALSENAIELYRKLWIADLHCDALLWQRDLLKRHRHGHVDIPRMIENNIALQVFTVVTSVPFGINFQSNVDKNNMVTMMSIAQRCPVRTWGSLCERTIFQGNRLPDAAQRSNGKFTIIKTKADLRAYIARREKEPEIAAGLLGIEGAQALEGNIDNLKTFFDMGFRLLGLTHFCDTDIAGSAQGLEKGGLTGKGRTVITSMEQLGMAIDLAHASERTIDDVLDMATKPVMVSHTGVQGICNSSRNLSDDHIKRIAQTNGVVGITYFEEALGEMSLEAIVRTIKYVADLAGVECIALGSDWDGAIKAALDIGGLVELVDALLRAGFSDDEIALIMGGNAQRVFLEVLPV